MEIDVCVGVSDKLAHQRVHHLLTVAALGFARKHAIRVYSVNRANKMGCAPGTPADSTLALK